MARMRRRFADRGEAAIANANRFRKLPNTPPPGMGGDSSGIMNPNLRGPAVGNTAGRGRGTYTKTPMGSYKFSPAGITRRPTKFPEEYEGMVGQNEGIMNTSPANNLMAKIYTNQMPGMVNRNKFWFDSLTPEADAINKVLNIPGMEGMRLGSEKDWNYKDFREKVPQYLWDELPEDAFETLSDFRNQGYITT
jgi:hypothetical protein